MCPLARCAANEVEMDVFNIQVESVADTILEETDLSFDSVMQHDGDVVDEISIQPLTDNFDKNRISASQSVLQPKSDKLTQSNQRDKKTKNKQERQKKKAEERQKKLIKKTEKKEVIPQRKDKRAIMRDTKGAEDKVIPEQVFRQYQYQSESSYMSLDANNEKPEEISQEDTFQRETEDTAASKHNLIEFLVLIGVLWIIWKVTLRGWHRRCKKCGKWWALQRKGSELIDSWETDKLVKLYDKNSKGEIVGTREALRRVKKNRYRVYWKCKHKHCGYECTSIETTTVEG